MHLYQVSTGKLHPDAQRPVISVMQTEWERPAVGIEIVGNNLVLILAYHDNPHKPDDCVFVYEWKSGTLKMVCGPLPIAHLTYIPPRPSGPPIIPTRASSFSLKILSCFPTRILVHWSTGVFHNGNPTHPPNRSSSFHSQSLTRTERLAIFHAALILIPPLAFATPQGHSTLIRITPSLSSTSVFAQQTSIKYPDSLIPSSFRTASFSSPIVARS